MNATNCLRDSALRTTAERSGGRVKALLDFPRFEWAELQTVASLMNGRRYLGFARTAYCVGVLLHSESHGGEWALGSQRKLMTEQEDEMVSILSVNI